MTPRGIPARLFLSTKKPAQTGRLRLLKKLRFLNLSFLYPRMLKRKRSHQSEMEFVTLEELAPKDHLLCEIGAAIDFSFIYDKVEKHYCSNNGRPPVDPVLLFKMLFIGSLFGIRSERQLENEVQVNMAYRWFLGLGLRGRVPDHSTFSYNRNNCFKNTEVCQEIFDEIVLQALALKMASGRTLYADSTI
jgi:transposase